MQLKDKNERAFAKSLLMDSIAAYTVHEHLAKEQEAATECSGAGIGTGTRNLKRGFLKSYLITKQR